MKQAAFTVQVAFVGTGETGQHNRTLACAYGCRLRDTRFLNPSFSL